MLGLKYNFNFHRVYILERKTEKEWAKIREGDRREKWKKSLSGRGTMESKDHEVRNKRSRILEQKQSPCLMEVRWEQRSKQELYWQRPGTLKSRVRIFLRQWGATGISIMWVTQSNCKVTCSIHLPIDKNLVFIVMYNHYDYLEHSEFYQPRFEASQIECNCFNSIWRVLWSCSCLVFCFVSIAAHLGMTR